MTKEELLNIKKELQTRENEIDQQQMLLSNEKHEVHMKLRQYYKQYVDEHFPYKIGDKLKYTFTNSDDDIVTREIEVIDISCYRCNLSEITLYYKWNNMEFRIVYIYIDGTICNSNDKIEKICTAQE